MRDVAGGDVRLERGHRVGREVTARIVDEDGVVDAEQQVVLEEAQQVGDEHVLEERGEPRPAARPG